jgi:AbiV family abortive infection protein
MTNDVNKRSKAGTAAIQLRAACLEHTENLVSSAERVLGTENAFHNIAYHLAVLAMEEIGKAQMIVADAVSGSQSRAGKLDDHVSKLTWAIWYPTMLDGQIDPKKFEEAGEFARRLHAKRIGGLYVNHEQTVGDDLLPSSAVSVADVQVILEMARVGLRIEKSRDPSKLGLPNANLDWFLRTVSEERGKSVLLSKHFIQKLEELVEPAAWVAWARSEFERISSEQLAFLEKERAKPMPAIGSEEPRWVISIRLNSRWHAIRQKSLNIWNAHVPSVQFAKPKEFKDGDFLLELTLDDTIKVDDVFDAGLMWSKMILACLNVGTCGFVWYQVSGGQDRYFDKIKDLKNPDRSVEMGKPRGLAGLTIDLAGENGERHKDTLNENYMRSALKCFTVFSKLSNDDAEPIFGPYLYALTLLSKSDLHLSCEDDARRSFLDCLAAAIQKYGDWDGNQASLRGAIDLHLNETIPEKEHRDLILEIIDDNKKSEETPIAQAFHTKRLADICLAIAADRALRRQIAKESNHDEGA